MCGIAGIVSPNPVDPQGMARMLDALRYRGPDDEGIYTGHGATLGQRRLSIIDLAGGHQPIPNEDKSAWIVCNGEIYNYREIRKELIEKGHRFSTNSDSEVVLHLYEELGDRCVERLRGMFAFAIWDEERQRLFAARDRLGQKPFYYVQGGKELYFASEIKGLLAFDPSLAEMDTEALDQYLSLRIIASPRSMFRRIRKLPPAHTLSFDPVNGLQIARYWTLHYEPKLKGSDEELTDQLEERIIESIRLHMVSDVPVGAFMSGGLDSTLVVAMLMKHVTSEPIQTFTIGLPYSQFDEAPYARMVAERYGTRHHERIVTPSLLETLPDLLWHLDEPSDPLSICTYLIARMAREHVKVVLGGDGGDELFGGYDRYYGNRYASYYAMLPAFVRDYLIGPALRLIPDGGWYKSKAHQLKWLHKLSYMSGSARYARSLAYFYFGPDRKESLYGPAMKSSTRDFDPESSIREIFDAADAHDIVDRMLCADSFVRLPDHPVMILDRMTMANSLEARAPFMDHVVAEFSARLPARMKVRGRSLRYIQYRLAERYLPREVIERPKQGFSSALPYMLRDEYRLLFGLFLHDSQLARDGYLQQPAIDKLLAEHETGRVDNGNRLWLLLNSETWYRMFIQGETKSDLHARIAAHGRSSPVVEKSATA
ncbi:MAG TPA: asparagine synthase (glutamine-hydrolyzing) [Gammaproteobacteria bacterium]|nr:asparagine synthase (glutamine-hydrolyzing) [Gammaproteobacteria bacterium]